MSKPEETKRPKPPFYLEVSSRATFPLPERKPKGISAPVVVEEELKVAAPIRVSGHLVDQTLKYDYPKDSRAQLSLFDQLLPETLSSIADYQSTASETVVEGIKLEPSQKKVIDALAKLLDQNSPTSEPEKPGYYAGNVGIEIYPYGATRSTEISNKTARTIPHEGKEVAPKLAFTLYEITKEYKGGEAISGKDQSNVKAILHELEEKKFLIKYVEKHHKPDGTRIERKIEDFRSLIKILKLTETEYDTDNAEVKKTEELLVLLNPVFRHQIASKFILMPSDLARRTIIANGSHNLSSVTQRLRDYLLRELAHKRYEPELGLERFYYMLNEKYMKESRKKKMQKDSEHALAVMENLGLLNSYKITPGVTVSAKIILYINRNFV